MTNSNNNSSSNSNNRNRNNRYKKNNRNNQSTTADSKNSNQPKNNNSNKQTNQRDSQSNRSNNNRRHHNNRNNQNRNFRQNKESIVKKLNDQIDLSRDNLNLVKKFNMSLQKMVSYADPCSEEQLLWKQSYESWDIKEILGHVIQCNKLYLKRLEHILSDDESEIELFDQDQAVKSEEFDNHSLEILLKQLILSRKDLEIFCLNTSDEDWEKSRVHPEKGVQTFREIVAFISEHDAMHMNQMFMNMQRFKPWLVEDEKAESPEVQESQGERSEDSDKSMELEAKKDEPVLETESSSDSITSNSEAKNED